MVVLIVCILITLSIFLLWSYIVLFPYEENKEEYDKLESILTIDENENIIDIKIV